MEAEVFASAITRAAEAGKQVGMSEGLLKGASLIAGAIVVSLLARELLAKRQDSQEAVSQPVPQMSSTANRQLASYNSPYSAGNFL